MLNNNINLNLGTKFIKALIDTEFIFVKKNRVYANNLNNTLLTLSLDNNIVVDMLDIFKINTNLKQFIRILSSLRYIRRKTRKTKYLRSKFVVYI
jgi:hypothetical protein